MDRDRRSELLSAYLDGEVSPQERSDVERLLETAPELREELNDFARLSDLLRALPRESAPVELSAAIRHEAERKSLLGPEPAMPRRSLRREWLSAIAGMAVTVAGMVLMTSLVEQPEQQANTPALATMEKSEAFAVHDGTDGERQMNLAEREFAALPAEAMAKSAMLAPPPMSAAISAKAPAAEPLLAGKDQSVTSDADRDPLMNAAPAFSDLASVDDVYRDSVRIGDVLPYVERDGQGVAVVELTVVDIEAAGDRLAVLLGRHGLDVLPEAPADEANDAVAGEKQLARKSPRFQQRNGKPGDGEQQLLTIYVDASRDTIAQVMDEMVREQLFSRARLQPPVDGPELANLAATPSESAAASTESVQEQQAEGLEEQLLVNDAVEVVANYSRARNMSQQPEAKEALRRGAMPQDGQNTDQQRLSGNSPKPAGRMMKHRVENNAVVDDSPADATATLGLRTQNVGVARKQNAAVALQLDAGSGEVQNNSVAVAQRKMNGSKRVVADKMKAAAEPAKPDLQLNPLHDFAEQAPLETIRLLFVLQTTEPVNVP